MLTYSAPADCGAEGQGLGGVDAEHFYKKSRPDSGAR